MGFFTTPIGTIVVLVLLFWFRKGIKGLAKTTEVTVDTFNEASVDSLGTYSNEVAISNATVRADQMKRISELDAIVSNDEIRSALKNATNNSSSDN